MTDRNEPTDSEAAELANITVSSIPMPDCTDVDRERTPEQECALQALYGDGGFSSWERVLAKAKPEIQPDVLQNALVELYRLAATANVNHTVVSDWGFRIGELHSIEDNVDGLQEIISQAKCQAEKSAGDETATTSKSDRLCPHNLGDFLQLEIPKREMLLDPVLPEKGLAMCYAARGTGKTHVALGIAYAVATGTKFLKWQAPKPRRVLLVDGEMPAAVLQERLASIAAGISVEPDEGALQILAGDLIEEGGIGNLASSEVQGELEPWLADRDLLILDNLSSLTAVIRDNDAESWGPIQDWLLKLRRRGMSVLIVHHAGKGGQQRGTSRREDVLDTSISLRRPEDYNPTEGARFEVHLEKARGVHGDAASPFEAKLETRGGVAVWTIKEIEDVELARVKALLDDDLSVRDIAEETGLSKSKVQRLRSKIEMERAAANAGGDE